MIRATPSGALLAASLVLTIAGCVPASGPDPEACEEPAVSIELELTADGLSPDAPSVCRDQDVTFVVTSELDGVLHVHGYDSEVPAFTVADGETREITFTAGRSGQFPVEFHAEDDPRGEGVAVFTVHEP
ncbi:MAG TPA: hypothetical protein VLA76_01960 [Candidatus Angelobacter sp.]|nr:hypothetical protein [Candidatus Angelobacter sp.]